MTENVQEALVGLAEQGLKVMLVAHPDACGACRAMQRRIFDPLEAPRLPLDGCLTPPCRCRYEGYDPTSVVSRLLSAGVDAVKGHRLEEARELLYQVIDLDDRSEKAWLWLSGVVEGIDERIICLENVLAINPHHELASEGLRVLRAKRRERAAGQNTARKIKEARDAIDHIKASQPRVLTLRETPEAPTRPADEMAYSTSAAGEQPVRAPTERVDGTAEPPVSFAIVFLAVLVAVVLLILIGAALVSMGNLLR
jgi:hypothetical protein